MLIDRPPFDWAQVADKEEAARLLSFARPLTLSPKSCLWHAGDSPDLLVRVEQGAAAGQAGAGGWPRVHQGVLLGGGRVSRLPPPGSVASRPATAWRRWSPAVCSCSSWPTCASCPAGRAGTSTCLRCSCASKEEKEQLLLTGSPQARYQHFLDSFPALDARVPDHQIAAYLGITPISLSRIRKRLKELNKG